jgi:hypothetical protein
VNKISVGESPRDKITVKNKDEQSKREKKKSRIVYERHLQKEIEVSRESGGKGGEKEG